MVLVHSVAGSGWADGTLLENGSRGWLPTNYCEAYDYIPMRPLLKALTEFWDVIRSGSNSNLAVFRNQDYMRGLIAGVRYLLEKSDCLTRDAPVVQKYDNIRRTRKALLSDLSVLVKIAKRLQDYALGSLAGESVEDIFDEMLLKAFKVVTRGVKFQDIWNEDIELNRVVEKASTILGRPLNVKQAPHPSSTVPSRLDSFVVPRPMDPQVAASPEPQTCSAAVHGPSRYQQVITTSASYPGFGTQTTTDSRVRPTSLQSKRASLSHRMSYSSQTTGPRGPHLASEKLDSCYDAFLGVLGAFLGLHMQSRSSSELLLTTQQSVKSCRELLSVIEVVLDQDFRRSEMLLEAKDAMYDKITELVHAAREVFSPANSGEEDLIFLPQEGKRMVNAATACVRGAGECVAKTRVVLEQIGDFEVEPTMRSHTVTSHSNQYQSSVISQETMSQVSEDNTMDQTPHNLPPAPTRPPPQLDIPVSSLSPPRPLSAVFTPMSMDSQPHLLTPSTMSCDTASPFSSTFQAPILTPPTPAQTTDEDELAVSRIESSRRHKSLARNIVNSTGSDSTYVSSTANSRLSSGSQTSTRATSPDQHAGYMHNLSKDGLFSASQITLADEFNATEQKLLEKTYAHELMYNKEGQIIGGTLPALIEKLTAHDSTPDALFVSTFYLTFRLFTTPKDFAEALANRFQYVGETPGIAGPVRLRVYNIFKGWLESHWRHDCDDQVLPFVLNFARGQLTEPLPAAGKRLTELAEKVQTVHTSLVPRLISSIGKTNTSIAQYFNPETPMPPAIISKSQLAALKSWKQGGPNVSFLDFDPLELARQITLKESSIFCSILPEELLATEWMKRSGSLAVNVRAMSTLSTDLANLVADSILQLEEPKKRAVLIKHWVKIANKCVELNNYDTLMAIICSLNSSTISRLKKTWEVVSQKTKATLEELKKIVDVSRNYSVLRNRLQNHVPPCLPFVGTYLTDLTFVDHGNQTTRKLTSGAGSMDVINYDKHVKTAKVISELQRFQIPYRLTEIPELQTWMQDQLVRVRSSGEKSFQNYYRRSLILEPREQNQQNNAAALSSQTTKGDIKDRFDFLAWAHTSKDKSIATHG